MNAELLTVGVLAALAGLTGGFILANSFNRTTINALKTQLDQRKPAAAATSPQTGEMSVDPEEIKAKIAEADANPSDIAFQRNLGRGLYRFATIKKDPNLLEEAKRILVRANTLDPKDYEVIVDLGNAYFDLGYFKKDPASFKLARETYEKALAAKAEDADVRTDLALTYFVDEPGDLKKAVDELSKALKVNPKQERALQFLTTTYIRQSDWTNAQKTLDSLKSVNPKNDSIADLATQIETKTYKPQQ